MLILSLNLMIILLLLILSLTQLLTLFVLMQLMILIFLLVHQLLVQVFIFHLSLLQLTLLELALLLWVLLTTILMILKVSILLHPIHHVPLSILHALFQGKGSKILDALPICAIANHASSDAGLSRYLMVGHVGRVDVIQGHEVGGRGPQVQVRAEEGDLETRVEDGAPHNLGQAIPVMILRSYKKIFKYL